MPAACALGRAKHKGDEGHMAVALVAEQFLTTTAKQKVDALLQSDTDRLTANDIATRATKREPRATNRTH